MLLGISIRYMPGDCSVNDMIVNPGKFQVMIVGRGEVLNISIYLKNK